MKQDLVSRLNELSQRQELKPDAVIVRDAAAAIESLQALLKEADKKQAYQHDYICELVAEVEELKAAAGGI